MQVGRRPAHLRGVPLYVYSLKFIINTLGEKYYEQTATKRRHSMPAGAWAGAQPQL